MTLQDFIDLKHRFLYQNKSCFNVHLTDWRNNNKFVPEGYVYVGVWIYANCVDDGKPCRIESGTLMSIKEIEETSLDSHLTWFKNQITMLQMHEVEETLSLDGKRIFNPHNFSFRVIKEESQNKQSA